MADERQHQREDAATEEAAAAAAAIGGETGDEAVPPEQQAVREGGGGEAEGFELAEEALRRQASHEDPGTAPANDAFPAETDDGAAHGEADEEAAEDA